MTHEARPGRGRRPGRAIGATTTVRLAAGTGGRSRLRGSYEPQWAMPQMMAPPRTARTTRYATRARRSRFIGAASSAGGSRIRSVASAGCPWSGEAGRPRSVGSRRACPRTRAASPPCTQETASLSPARGRSPGTRRTVAGATARRVGVRRRHRPVPAHHPHGATVTGYRAVGGHRVDADGHPGPGVVLPLGGCSLAHVGAPSQRRPRPGKPDRFAGVLS